MIGVYMVATTEREFTACTTTGAIREKVPGRHFSGKTAIVGQRLERGVRRVRVTAGLESCKQFESLDVANDGYCCPTVKMPEP